MSTPAPDAAPPTVVLVPAYEPDGRLVALVRHLVADEPRRPVVVVDDGSGDRYEGVFAAVERAGAEVVRHDVNRGKGRALRTGLAHIRARHPGAAVVCADSDGQHTPTDISRVAIRLGTGADDLVLGVRRFTGRVPLRSRVGNAVTRRLFALVTGRDVVDTQTGLRGYPPGMLPWVDGIGGERFDHELRVLLRACRERRRIGLVDIETVYLDDNASSHFRPLADSLSVYRPLLGFALSSLLGFTLDVLALLALMTLTGQLLVAVVGARLLSASVNFAVNRRWVFGREGEMAPLRAALVRYATLAAGMLILGAMLLESLAALGMTLLAAKVVTELTLFVGGYVVQRTAVFAGSGGPHGRAQRIGTRRRVWVTSSRSMSARRTPGPASSRARSAPVGSARAERPMP